MNLRPRKYWIEEMVFRQWIVYKLLLKNQNQLEFSTVRIINADKIRHESKRLTFAQPKNFK